MFLAFQITNSPITVHLLSKELSCDEQIFKVLNGHSILPTIHRNQYCVKDSNNLLKIQLRTIYNSMSLTSSNTSVKQFLVVECIIAKKI